MKEFKMKVKSRKTNLWDHDEFNPRGTKYYYEIEMIEKIEIKHEDIELVVRGFEVTHDFFNDICINGIEVYLGNNSKKYNNHGIEKSHAKEILKIHLAEPYGNILKENMKKVIQKYDIDKCL